MCARVSPPANWGLLGEAPCADCGELLCHPEHRRWNATPRHYRACDLGPWPMAKILVAHEQPVTGAAKQLERANELVATQFRRSA